MSTPDQQAGFDQVRVGDVGILIVALGIISVDNLLEGQRVAEILFGNFAEPIAGLNGIFLAALRRFLGQDLIGRQSG